MQRQEPLNAAELKIGWRRRYLFPQRPDRRYHLLYTIWCERLGRVNLVGEHVIGSKEFKVKEVDDTVLKESLQEESIS